jgi:hypothetical protein
VRAILILPLPVRPVVQDTAAALLAGGLDGVFGGIPVVAEEVVRVHLVVDLVGAGRRGALRFGGSVGRLFARVGFGGDESCLFRFLHVLRLGDTEAAENVVQRPPLALGGIHGRCCEGTRREEDKQEVGDEAHGCSVVVRVKWEMEGEVDGRRKGEKGEMKLHIYSSLEPCRKLCAIEIK